MPHQCTNCGHTFPDGSKEMLSGCPDCGGNKFQFKPAGSSNDEPTQPEPTQPEPPQPETTSEPSTPESPQPASKPSESPPETEGVGDDSGFVSKELKNTDESPAQSSARSEVVSSSELTAAGATRPAATEDTGGTPDHSPESAPDQRTESPPDQPTDSITESSGESAADASADQPTGDAETEESSLDQLRQELNDQFESIRIVSPGQYELNLMELYDREEYIISLREDGRYVIEVPDGWGDS